MKPRFKVGVLTTHPIQYQAPLFKKISEHPDIDLTVYFKERKWVTPYKDKEFGIQVRWDIPLLEEYKHVFLKNPLDSVRVMLRSPFDAVIFYGWNSVSNAVGLVVTLLKGRRVFIYSETPLSLEIQKKGVLQRVKRAFLRALFRRASAALYIGEENKKFYQYLGVPEKKLFFTPYAVENERFIKGDRERARQELSIGKDSVVILFVGKLIPKKRPFDLLKAFELMLPADCRQSTLPFLVFVGEGALRPNLEEYVREKNIKNVRFAGFKNQTELPAYYHAADIFTLPSGAGETWGLVVNEAMCASLPVVVSRACGCAADLVRSNQNGFVYEAGDVQELSEKIITLTQNSDLRKNFGRESRMIIDTYSFENDIEGIVSALSATVR